MNTQQRRVERVTRRRFSEWQTIRHARIANEYSGRTIDVVLPDSSSFPAAVQNVNGKPWIVPVAKWRCSILTDWEVIDVLFRRYVTPCFYL